MQPGVTVPDELLTVSFPNGTLVDDQTVGGNKPLQYVVGGPKPPTKLDQVATGSNRSDVSKVEGTEQSTNASNAPAAAGHAAASKALAATEHTTGAAGVLRAKLPWPISLTHIVLVALAAATLVACLAWRHTRRRGHSQS
jgi:hypothetical protein